VMSGPVRVRQPTQGRKLICDGGFPVLKAIYESRIQLRVAIGLGGRLAFASVTGNNPLHGP
jgi:hypothetical protein